MAGEAVSSQHVGIAEHGMHASPVFVEVKKAISWRISASKRLVLILTFSFVIATVKSPPLMPVLQSSACYPQVLPRRETGTPVCVCHSAGLTSRRTCEDRRAKSNPNKQQARPLEVLEPLVYGGIVDNEPCVVRDQGLPQGSHSTFTQQKSPAW